MIAFIKDEDKRGMLFLIIGGVSLVLSFFCANSFPVDPAWLVIILCGTPIVIGAVQALIKEFDVKADVLVSLALIASIIIGETFAAGEVAFIMTLGAMLEDRTVAKARAGIEKLVQLTPRTARLLCNGEENIIAAEDVKAGDVLRVLAGETIAVDGLIISGQTSINQSVMTGESLPVDKGVGDEVSSGTVNQFGAFDMKAVNVGEDSSLQRMIRLVESADAGKAKIVGFADRFATWIVIIALVSAGLTWIVTGEIIRAVTILVVFCPCALVLATPTAIMAAIGNATKYGILVREGDALERLAKISHVAFDKTGTLTYGTPTVAEVHSLSPAYSAEQLLAVTASAERLSEHPLGKAITAYYQDKYGKQAAEPQEFTLVAGRGVKACVLGEQIVAGNEAMIREHEMIITEKTMTIVKRYKDDGDTVIFVAIDGAVTGLIALTDQLRSNAKQVVENIENKGVGTILLTGDNEYAAKHIARETGIAEVYANCLPETKLQVIEEYQQRDKLICMIGDGVNDAPALKKAYVGIAMGGVGSDIAIEAADIALVGDDIKQLPHLLHLSQKMMQKIKFNLTASMMLNIVAIILAMLGLLNPVVGALVHNVGSVVVIINSSLLLRWKEVNR